MNILYAASSEIGWRESMEDEYAIYLRPKHNFFSAEVYDGHGGKEASIAASEMLTPVFLHLWYRELEKPLQSRSPIHKLIRESYLAVDRYVVGRTAQAGSTAAVLYLIGDMFFASNAGDTRIVIGTAQGCVTLTSDHKPHLPGEKERIEALGGKVIRFGVPRVQGILAVSRSLGDAYLKPFVSAEPRIVEGVLGKENDFAIIACDGVWDVLQADEVMDIVRRNQDVEKAPAGVTEEALARGTTDNVTVITLDLRPFTSGLSRDKSQILSVYDIP